ncbi:MAG: DNA-directed DNA polymerase I [Thermoproteota archaeon]|nr:MAG: DNA-directed DNA polymerase I [Candidatus Korarchaeota archaeon]
MVRLVASGNSHREASQLVPAAGRVGYLLSVYYEGSERKAVAKLYDPESGEIFHVPDWTGHRPYLLTDARPEEIEELAGRLAARIAGYAPSEKWDVVRLRKAKLTRVETKDPLAVGGDRGGGLRELLGRAGHQVWEARIKYYESYIYDVGLIPGLPYRVSEDGRLEPLIPEDVELPRLAHTLSDEASRRLVEDIARILEVRAPKMRSVALDIEVAAAENQIPSVKEVRHPVIAAALAGDDENEVHLLRRGAPEVPGEIDGARVVVHESEAELIRTVLDKISRYPVVFTFNGDGFDMPYLAKRAQELGVNPRPIRLERDRALLDTGVHIDLYQLYSNRSVQVYIFGGKYLGTTLDEIAQAIVGVGKLEVGRDFTSIETARLASYCYRDAKITHMLGNVLNGRLIDLLMLFARLSKLPLEDVSRLGISQWIKNMIYFEYRRRGWLIPNKEEIILVRGAETYSRALIKGKKYMGAIVLEPVPGVHFDVHVMDFASLYPSIIARWRVSFETVNCPHAECRSNRPVEGLPHWICTHDEVGLIPKLIGVLRDLRVGWYKRLAKDKSLPEEQRRWYDVVQSGLKVLLNASYGVFGYENFPLYSPPAAEMITALARKAMTTALRIARELGLNVVYGDTDSLFIKGASEGDLRALERRVEEELGIDIELEKHYRYVILSRLKKNYLGVRDDGTVDIKGLLGKKRNVPDLIRRAFAEVIDILRSVHDPADFEGARREIKEKIREYVNRLKNREFSLEEVSFRMVLTKPLKSYVKTTPQHVKAAKMLEARGIRVYPGTVIEFVKTTGRQGVKPVSLAKKEEVDIQKYMEIMKTTFEQILDVLGIDFDEVAGGVSEEGLAAYF